jgi:hypothetical protein
MYRSASATQQIEVTDVARVIDEGCRLTDVMRLVTEVGEHA